MASALIKGGNAALIGKDVALAVAPRGTAVDVSALLLGPGKKVRSDDDLVFYNHPSQDGVSVSGRTVTVGLDKIPDDVISVLVVVSADPDHPGTVFTAAPSVTITQPGSTLLSFVPPDFTNKETVVVLAELYRRAGGWKVRAVGQGYASGLAGLATDYGVDVEDGSGAPASDAVVGAGPTSGVNLSKVEARAPALVGAARQAGLSLERAGVGGKRAAIHLILAHDYGMEKLYESFAIQRSPSACWRSR